MMNQEIEQDFPPQQEIPPANSSHEYGGGSDSAVTLLNGGGFTVLQLPQLSSSAIKPPLTKCTGCGFGSAKKRSPPPSSLSSLYQPSSKRPAISFTTTSSPDPTPPSSSERKRQMSPLRRSLSDFPCSPVGVGGAYYYQHFPNPAAAAAFLKNPLSPSQMLPGNSKISRIPLLDSQISFPMVPGQHRSPSNSNPSSSDYGTLPVNTSPPRPPPSSAEGKRSPLRRSLSDFPCSPVGGAYYKDFPNPVGAALKYPSSPCQRSPNSKKLRRELKGKVEELMQAVCEQQEDEDDEDEDEDVNINCINKEKTEHQNQNRSERGHDDSVWVKQTEGGLVLHFNCPCGEGYEVFLRGDKCYYRLA